jgi:hypothetical protein
MMTDREPEDKQRCVLAKSMDQGSTEAEKKPNQNTPA